VSRYPAIRPEDALRYLHSRQLDDGSVHLEDIRHIVGAGSEIASVTWKELRQHLVKLRKRFPAKLRKKDPQGGRFESEACVVVHTCLAGVDRTVLADHDFWTWLATDLLADIVEWRFGTDGAPTQPANYGIGVRSENMLFRLWLRAELGKTAGPEPYKLAQFGDQDLWRSHLLRQGYANARTVVHSMLKLQAGELLSAGKPAKRLAGGEEPNGVRMLAKRLRRMRANVLFEFLSPQQTDSLVFELSSDLKKGN